MLDESFLEHSFEDILAEGKEKVLISVSKGKTTETYWILLSLAWLALHMESKTKMTICLNGIMMWESQKATEW